MKVGTGWCGWTEAETDDTTMPTILLAYEGVQDRLRFAAKPPPKPKTTSKTPATTRAIAAMFGNK